MADGRYADTSGLGAAWPVQASRWGLPIDHIRQGTLCEDVCEAPLEGLSLRAITASLL